MISIRLMLSEQVMPHSIEKSYHLIGGPLGILESLSLDIFLQDVVINHSGPPGLEGESLKWGDSVKAPPTW